MYSLSRFFLGTNTDERKAAVYSDLQGKSGAWSESCSRVASTFSGL
jgi:hypothetical protein